MIEKATMINFTKYQLERVREFREHLQIVNQALVSLIARAGELEREIEATRQKAETLAEPANQN